MIDKVLCTAPLTSILIDTNKGVRPCCYYEGNFLGNIKDQAIPDIMKNDKWKKLRQQMYDKEWPTECLGCKRIEDASGRSLRHSYLGGGGIDITDWESDSLTILEFNGSNICNLACLHCHGGFSSKWVAEQKKIKEFIKIYEPEKQKRISLFRSIVELSDDTRYQSTKNHVPDSELVLSNLKQIDLSTIRMVIFKGGEPLLNAETITVLQYLEEKNLIENIKVSVSTNCTYINDEIIRLFNKCKHVEFLVSIDGIGELFNYTRYGDAKFEKIEKVLALANTVTNISIAFCNAAMNYAAFSLVEVRDWGIKMSKKYDKVSPITAFNVVMSPAYLSMGTLSDECRRELIKYYSENSIDKEFDYIINLLSKDYLGDKIHAQWIEYTELMQTMRKNNILDIVPQLANELKVKK